MTMAIPSDHSLLRRFWDGQAEAPTLLYRRSARRLHALAARRSSAALSARVDPEDVVQSIFHEFFRGAAEGRYDVPEGEEIWRLLPVIALNKIRAVGTYHRATRRDVRRTTGGEGYDRAIESVVSSDEGALATLRMVVDEVLDTLPPGHRPIVERRIEGSDVAEIAGETGRSKRTVERVLQEFRRGSAAQVRQAS